MVPRPGVTCLAWLVVALAGCGDNAAQAPAVGLQSIAITPSLPTVAAGTSMQLTATATDADGQTTDVSGLVNWASASTSIAKVGPTGLLTGVSPGAIAVTVSRGGVVGTTTATVSEAVLVAIAVTALTQNIELKQILPLTAIGTYSNGIKADLTSQVTWASDNPAHIAVSDHGLISSVAAGFATITATLGTIAGSLVMSVDPPALFSIEIVTDPPGLFQVKIGDSLQLAVSATFSDLSTQPLPADAVQWFSNNPDIATVDAAGLVTPVGVGTAILFIATGSLLSFASVEVLPAD